MKVKYFAPEIFDLDNLMNDPPVIRAKSAWFKRMTFYLPLTELVIPTHFTCRTIPFQSSKILISLGKSVVWKQQETYGNQWENL